MDQPSKSPNIAIGISTKRSQPGTATAHAGVAVDHLK